MLPNLIVIGAERCGTTSLHLYLDRHPQISMSDQKELNFFVAERNWQRGRAWYERRFSASAAVRGESSPAYTAYPDFDGVPARIAALIPEAKLIYLVRDPVARTISALHLARALGSERRPPAEALTSLDTSPYVARSRYATQLERYLEHFPIETIKVVDSDALRHRRAETLREIFSFLGVQEDAWHPEMDSEIGTAKLRKRNIAGRALWGIGRRTIGDPRTRGLMRRTPAWVSAPVTASLPPIELDAELRRELEVVLTDEVARLRDMTGLRFEAWSL